MEESVLERITQILTEGRINEALHQSNKYKEAKREEEKLYEQLISDLNDEQKKRLDEFICSTTQAAAIWEKFSYQQGMKDLFSLFKSLS